jgi:hypothetical protein
VHRGAAHGQLVCAVALDLALRRRHAAVAGQPAAGAHLRMRR